MGIFPAFFKVYLSTSSQRLPLPLAFCSLIKGAKSGRAFLRNCSGQLWPVTVSRHGNQLFFDNGWAEFVEANHVKVGDIFVFDFTGNSTFDFKLLGGDRCGKMVNWSPGRIKEELPDLEEQENVIYVSSDESEDTTGDDSNDSDEEYREGEEENTDTDDLDDEDYEDDEMTTDFQKRKVENFTKRSKAVDVGPSYANKGKSFHQVKGETKDLDVDSDSVLLEDDYSAEEAGDTKRKRPVTQRGCCEDFEDIFQYGLITPPKNPYFVAKHLVKRSGSVHIPVDVINDFKLRIPPKLNLLDEEGREWTVTVKFWKDGRAWIGKGWRAFCKWNRLRPEDRCICEFIRLGGRRELQLKTRIVRNRSWLPKSGVATKKV